VRNHWLGVGILMLVGGLVAGFFLWLFDVPGAWTLGVGLMVAGGVVAGFSRAMPGRTPKGAAEARRWEAFRNYLRDLTRFDDLPRASELCAEHLPYAVAFGVERDWVRRFEGLNVSAPGWYVIAGGTERRPATVPGMHARETAAPRSGGGAVVDEGVVPWSMSSPARPIESAASVQALTLDSLSDRMFTALERLSDSLTAMPASGGSRSSGASTTRRSFSSSSSSLSRPGRSAGGSWSGSRGGGGYRAG